MATEKEDSSMITDSTDSTGNAAQLARIADLLESILEAQQASAVQLAQILAELALPRLRLEKINAAALADIVATDEARRAREATAATETAARPRLFASAPVGGFIGMRGGE